MEPRFLQPTPSYHELALLLAVHRRRGLSVPVNPHELPPAVLENVPLSRLLDDGLVEMSSDKTGRVMRLTPSGQSYLRGLVIDYHLELMDRRAASNDFFTERVRMLERAGCRRILLYGASDTARALLDFLKDSRIQTAAVLDDDRSKQGSTIGGVPVVPPAALTDYDFDSVVVTTILFQDVILRDKADIVPPGKRLIGLFDDFLTNGVHDED